jgi:hypothetical protein
MGMKEGEWKEKKIISESLKVEKNGKVNENKNINE